MYENEIEMKMRELPDSGMVKQNRRKSSHLHKYQKVLEVQTFGIIN